MKKALVASIAVLFKYFNYSNPYSSNFLNRFMETFVNVIVTCICKTGGEKLYLLYDSYTGGRKRKYLFDGFLIFFQSLANVIGGF